MAPRAAPIPAWLRCPVSVSTGALFRRVGRLGKLWGARLTPKAIWHIVKAAAKRADINNLAPAWSTHLGTTLSLGRGRT